MLIEHMHIILMQPSPEGDRHRVVFELLGQAVVMTHRASHFPMQDLKKASPEQELPPHRRVNTVNGIMVSQL